MQKYTGPSLILFALPCNFSRVYEGTRGCRTPLRYEIAVLPSGPSLGDEVVFEPVAHLVPKDCVYSRLQLVERPEEPAGKPPLQIPPHGLDRVQPRSVGREKLQLGRCSRLSEIVRPTNESSSDCPIHCAGLMGHDPIGVNLPRTVRGQMLSYFHCGHYYA